MESITSQNNLEMPLVINNTKTESLITSIEKLKMVVNSFDSGDILVKNDSTTLFHTSCFGQFFYDNYVSTTKMVETKINIKENDTIKMPTMNFDFGPFTEPGVVALSPYGIAIRSSKGEYLTCNRRNCRLPEDAGGYQRPAGWRYRGKPMYVQSVEEDGIHCIDILNSENKVIVPVTNMFGFNFVTKVVSLMNFNAAQPSAENPFGNLMPFMMMSWVMILTTTSAK